MTSSVAAPLTLPDARSPAAEDTWVAAVPTTSPADAIFHDARPVADGPVSVLVHGRLDNFDDLAVSVPRAESSPAAVVAALYRAGGREALARLRGAFAAVIVDRARDLAIALRDPIGLHPLFYVESGGTTWFATDTAALLTRAGLAPRANRYALADHLCHRWPDPGETYLDGVRRVLPGSALSVGDGGRLRSARYWDPAPAGRPVDWIDPSDLAEFDATFDRAVSRSLAGDRTGIFLSGGLDSIAVAAVAADRCVSLGRPRPVALSLSFPDPSCDESPVQASVARTLGLSQHLISFDDALDGHQLFSRALSLNAGAPFPVMNAWAPAYEGLARRGRQDGVQTILTGTGGDEWLSVSPYLAADLIGTFDWRGFVQLFASWRRSFRIPTAVVAKRALWTFGLRPLAGRTLHRHAPAAWTRSRLARLVRRDPPWVAPKPALRQALTDRAAGSLADADPDAGFYVREVRTGLDHALVSLELEDRYRFGRRLGVQLTHPFWDADLVDLLFRTPPLWLLRGGRSKGLVRDTVARRFPALGLDRQRKIAATTVFRTRLLAEAPMLARRVADFSALGALGVVDPPGARRVVDAALASPELPGLSVQRAWDLLNLETWARSLVN